MNYMSFIKFSVLLEENIFGNKQINENEKDEQYR